MSTFFSIALAKVWGKMWWEIFRPIARPIFAFVISLLVGLLSSGILWKIGKKLVDVIYEYGRVIFSVLATVVVGSLFMVVAMNESELLDESMDQLGNGVGYTYVTTQEYFHSMRLLLCERSKYMPRRFCFNQTFVNTSTSSE